MMISKCLCTIQSLQSRVRNGTTKRERKMPGEIKKRKMELKFLKRRC